MKSIAIILVSYLILLVCACNKDIKYPERKETGFLILDIEKEAGVNVPKEAYEFLDKILYEIGKVIVIKKNYTNNEAKELLRIIGYIIRKNEITINENNNFFSSALINKKFVCYDLSLLYICIAERYKLPIVSLHLEGFSVPGESSPGHVLVIWKDSTKEILWETTMNTCVSILFLKETAKVDISDSSDRFKCFIDSTNESFLFEKISYLFCYFLGDKKYNKSKLLYDKLTKVTPDRKQFVENRDKCKFLLELYNSINKYKIKDEIIIDSCLLKDELFFDTSGVDAIYINDASICNTAKKSY